MIYSTFVSKTSLDKSRPISTISDKFEHVQKDWALIPLFAIFATKQRYHLPLPVSPVDFLVCSTHLDSLIAWHKFKNPFQLFASLIHFQQNVISAIHSEKFIKDIQPHNLHCEKKNPSFLILKSLSNFSFGKNWIYSYTYRHFYSIVPFICG